MGVYIKGMDMPESCHQCVAGYGGFCFVCPAEEDGTCPDHGRPEWCPLIGLPAQHGRLIDGDVAEVIVTDEKDEVGGFLDGILYAAGWIADQPTIIEAEGGDV